jgi:hypothetical protein
VQNDRARTANTVPARDGKPPPAAPEQYAGVFEFSAPDGVAAVPSWMMTNLKMREGGKIAVATVKDLPPGQFVRLRCADGGDAGRGEDAAERLFRVR